MTGMSRVGLIPLLLGAVVLAAVWAIGQDANPGPLGFPLDDSWIHMVYGRGLVENGYLAYNDSSPTTGATSPLWALCLALLHACVCPAKAGVFKWE